MDNQRLFLWGSFVLVWFLVYQAWVQDYGPKPPAQTATPDTVETPQVPTADDLPALADDLPSAPGPADASSAETTATAVDSALLQTVSVLTDVLDLKISLVGGDLVNATLLKYPRRKDQPDVKVQLLSATAPVYVFQTGLRGAADTTAPDHRVVYTAPAARYRLGDGDDTLVVPLTWRGPDGVEVTKQFTFRRGRYDIDLDYTVDNQGSTPFNAASYVQIKRRLPPLKRSMTSVETYSFRGPVLYDGDSYEKLDVDDLADEPVSVTTPNGWIAAIQHHFLTAAVPPPGEPNAYSARVSSADAQTFLVSAIGPVETIAPGASGSYREQLFVGPKLQKQLRAIRSDLALTVDYGFLTPIAQPIFWVMQKIHNVVGNWGWTIVILTLLIKLIFYKLTETSGRSMAKMRKLQPRLKALQERYKDDRQKLSEAMMKMYREEKANPAAGCLPILVQMPVFLALYWVLLESVELRQAPWMLWIQDLSSRDPYFILPALMAASMFLQQKLNPAPTDPIQARVMMIMPLAMSAFMAFFPAGLVLYWFVNTLLSVLQQWRINTVIERGG